MTDKPPMPPQPVTKDLPKVEVFQALVNKLAADITRAHHESNARVDEGFKAVKLDIEGLKINLGAKVDDLASRTEKIEAWRQRTSDRARKLEAHDSSSDIIISEEIIARETLDEKVDRLIGINTRLEKVFANPNIKIIIAVLATAMTTWLANKGFH